MKNSILLAEDDPQIREIITDYFSAKDDFILTCVPDGSSALELLQTQNFDLILLDVMMPGIDGFEVIRRLRADPATADIQIVILSALNSNEDIVKGFNVGANDFIMKPIIMEKLLSCVVTQMQIVQSKAR